MLLLDSPVLLFLVLAISCSTSIGANPAALPLPCTRFILFPNVARKEDACSLMQSPSVMVCDSIRLYALIGRQHRSGGLDRLMLPDKIVRRTVPHLNVSGWYSLAGSTAITSVSVRKRGMP